MKNETDRVHLLIQQYLDNAISNEDRAELLRLIRCGKIDEMLKDKIGETLRDELLTKTMLDSTENTRGKRIFESIMGHDESPSEKRFPYMIRYAASLAIILCAAGLFVYFITIKETIQAKELTSVPVKFITITNKGLESKKVELQDGSTVVLEPGSEIRYKESFKNDREVFLAGEAFFEVTKDPEHPFFVYANEVTTKVLGTSFMIKANKLEKEIVVAVKTGKVSVSAKSNDNKFQNAGTAEITLTPNQQAIYKRGEHVVVKKVVEEPEIIVAQNTLKSIYVNEQVTGILKALSESYGVDIRFDANALAGCTLTSDIIESEGLYDQLEIICSALGGSYVLENDASIVIKANGCSK